MELTFGQKFREHYNVENTYNCTKLYVYEWRYYKEHNKTCSWEDGVVITVSPERKKRKKRETDSIKNIQSKLIKSKSNKFVVRKLNCGYDGKIHNIHHCFGDVVESFVIMNKQDHQELHRKFGSKNENCLITNEQVKEFIMNHEHILVENGKITENTFSVISSSTRN